MELMDGWPMYNKICISKPWEVKTRRVQDLCFLLRSIDRYSPRYLFKEFAILDIGKFKWCLSGILPLIQFIMMDI